MSVRHALLRGLELGRTLLQPALQAATRTWILRRTAQPWTFLQGRFGYYRTSLRGLAAQLQARGSGSPRNRVVFLAFGLGVGLIERQQEDRHSAAICRQIQMLFQEESLENAFKSIPCGYKLEDYVMGRQIGKGCNAAVYEAASVFAANTRSSRSSLVELYDRDGHVKANSVSQFPLAVKMMWNIGAGSSSEAILSSMCHELVPAVPQAVRETTSIALDGHFGPTPKVFAHPNVITVYRAFTAEVPLLPGAQQEYPAVLPTRLNSAGMGNNHTLFLVMKKYPYTLRQYLEVSVPSTRESTLMVLQLLEGVDHLCQQGIAHRDLKSDNVLVELDSDGFPHLVITDFGCCLVDRNLLLPLNSHHVNRGGNSCLMAPEVITAIPGPGVVIDYSKADAWAVGAIAYEIFGQPNAFYNTGTEGLDSRKYQEKHLPPLPPKVPNDTQLVVQLLLRRNPNKRPSARVAANMLHLSLWGAKSLCNQDWVGVKQMADWLLIQTAVVLLRERGAGRTMVETQIQKCFLANVTVEDLRAAIGFLMYSRTAGMTSL